MDGRMILSVRILVLVFALLFVGWLKPTKSQGAEIKSIGFKVENGSSVIEIVGDGPLTYSKEENAQDNQIVLNLAETDLSGNASRKLDTSSFDSPVSLVSPYQVDGQARVVIQLRQMVGSNIRQDGNRLLVEVLGGDGGNQEQIAATSEEPLAEEEPVEEVADADSEGLPEESAQSVRVQLPGKNNGHLSEHTEAMQKASDNLSRFEQTQKTGQFRGKPITLKVKDADVKDVLRMISEASGFNMILGPNVAGTITLSLENVPWDQVLDIVLKTLQLGAERHRNVLRVMTLTNLAAEKSSHLQAKRAAENSAPRVTRVFPISYADVTELSGLLRTFGQSGLGGSSPNVSVDTRTRSIIVQDIAPNLDRMAKLVEILDTQTPQVLIEAKIVEASEGFSQSISGSLAGAGIPDGDPPNAGNGSSYYGSFNSGSTGDLFGTVFQEDGSDIGRDSSNGGSFGFSPTLGIFPGFNRINAFLSLSEVENKVEVISSPKTVVLNNQQAEIVQGVPVPVQRVVSDESGTAQQVTDVQEARISLGATATVTNDESVLLDLNISRDVPVPVGDTTAIGRRNITSKVLVDNGSTLVIGGIYISDSSETHGGFPILKDLPLLGYLFGAKRSLTSRAELFIFVTPKILNVNRAGLGT